MTRLREAADAPESRFLLRELGGASPRDFIAAMITRGSLGEPRNIN
jgi:hypothetical protein